MAVACAYNDQVDPREPQEANIERAGFAVLGVIIKALVPTVSM